VSALRVRVVARLDLRNRSMNRFMAASLAVHVAFAAGLGVVSSRSRAPRINPDAIAVTLTGGVPASQTRVQQAAPPQPPAEPPPPVEEPAPKEATIEPNPVKVTKKPAAKKPEPAEPVAPQPSPTEEDASGSGTTGPGGGAGESTVASLELGDVEFAWYGTSVTAALQSNYTPPMLTNVRQTLVVVVSFEILRDGSVRNIRIESPSGVRSMDRSALRAVTDAAPLPALPAGLGSDTLPARFEFRWYPGAE
jgi:protein TonB